MDTAHAHIYVYFVGHKVPALRELLDAMRDPQRKKEISEMIPGSHKMLSTALNAHNPIGHNSHPMVEVRKLNGPPPTWWMEILTEKARTTNYAIAVMRE